MHDFNLHAIKECFTILFNLAEKFWLYFIICDENVNLISLLCYLVSDTRSVVKVERLRFLLMFAQPVAVTDYLLG